MRLRKVVGKVKRRLRPPMSDEIPKSLIARFLPADPVVLEAGAHRGTDTVGLATMWPAGTIHAFEPIPALFAAMSALTADCPNVRRHPVALSRTSGTAEMWVSGGELDHSSSLREPKAHLEELPGVTFEERIMVETVSLDDWSARHQVPRVDAMWLDLQGAELDALRGGERLLATTTVVCTEAAMTEMYAGGALYPEVRAWLEARGFRVQMENRPWPNGAGNVLFVRS